MDAKLIGERIKKLRGNKSRKELADILGVSESSVQMWENGERIPRDEVKKRIAQYFNVSVDSIFFNF